MEALRADGNLGYQITTRPFDRGVEIALESWWKNLEHIKSRYVTLPYCALFENQVGVAPHMVR